MQSRSLVLAAGVTSLLAGACGQVASTTSTPQDAGAAVDAYAPVLDAGIDAPIDILPDSTVDAAPPPPPAHAAVLFGGDGPAFMADTWEWDGASWTERTFDTSPSKRSDQAMASLGDTVVLFGGAIGSNAYDDTWEYDGKAWTEQNVPGPTARQRHGMAPIGSRVVLFGGLGAAGDVNDTWEYDGKTWTEIKIAGPSAREGFAMAALGDKVVLYGGIGGGNLEDTWTYDGTAWTELKIPGPKSAHGMRFAPAMANLHGKLVLFSGENDANDVPADTWEFDGTAWTQVSVTGPEGRWHSGMTSFAGSVVLFGGDPGSPGGGGFLSDTWTFDGTTWTQHTGNGPGGRYVYAFAPR